MILNNITELLITSFNVIAGECPAENDFMKKPGWLWGWSFTLSESVRTKWTEVYKHLMLRFFHRHFLVLK